MTTESTKTAATEVLYNSLEQQVTIRCKDGGVIVLPLQDALRLGQQLVNLLNPIDSWTQWPQGEGK
jgi:hypothetical protein